MRCPCVNKENAWEAMCTGESAPSKKRSEFRDITKPTHRTFVSEATQAIHSVRCRQEDKHPPRAYLVFAENTRRPRNLEAARAQSEILSRVLPATHRLLGIKWLTGGGAELREDNRVYGYGSAGRRKSWGSGSGRSTSAAWQNQISKKGPSMFERAIYRRMEKLADSVRAGRHPVHFGCEMRVKNPDLGYLTPSRAATSTSMTRTSPSEGR